MTYTVNNVYGSLINTFRTFVPSGIKIVDGESYGVMRIEPGRTEPSIAVNIFDVQATDIELGSFGTEFTVVCTTAGKSRSQRDAINSIVYSGLMTRTFPVYTAYDPSFAPASGSTIYAYVEVGDFVQVKPIQNFSTDQEKYFWTSVVSFTLKLIGV